MTVATSGRWPSNGTVVVGADGNFSLHPERQLQRSDSFTYTITDADGDISPPPRRSTLRRSTTCRADDDPDPPWKTAFHGQPTVAT